MAIKDAKFYLDLSKKHLERVQAAASGPDWADLSMYGLYCLEAAVRAAALHVKIYPKNASHSQKQKLAETLHTKYNLSDISNLLSELNEVRKSEAYGDIENPPELDAEDVASEIEKYVEAVATLINA